MSDAIVILFVLYVQVAVYTAWYFFHRRVKIARRDVAQERATREAAQGEMKSKLEALSRIVEELRGLRTQAAPQQRESPAFKQARRRGALEMSKQGLSTGQIAETLNMRPYEVETLIRLERLKQGTAAEDNTRHWLDPMN